MGTVSEYTFGGGYKIGVEICADHGELKTHFHARPHEPLLDLYFFASCGPSIVTKDVPVKNLGYALCSNGKSLDTVMLRREDQYGEPDFKIIPCKNPIREYVSRTDIYELDMRRCA